MKFGFIAKHRGIWPVRSLCETLEVSRSGFYTPGRHVDPAPVRAAINGLGGYGQNSHFSSDRTYGARRVWHEVLAEALPVGCTGLSG